MYEQSIPLTEYGKWVEKQKPTKPKCTKCGFRIRGANHEQGWHHRGVTPNFKHKDKKS